jgi:threonine/homoserine/homoserine lactone efflux protein
MEPLLLYLKLVGVGLAIAAPIGPMTMLCVRRSLSQGVGWGIATGLGIATGDAVYASAAAFGTARLTSNLASHHAGLQLLSGGVLFFVGLKSFVPKREAPKPSALVETAFIRSKRSAFASAFLLTLSNPMTIALFAAIFTSLAPSAVLRKSAAYATVAGIATGSLIWWIALVSCLTLLKKSIENEPGWKWIDKITGGGLMLWGIGDIARLLF